MVTRRSSVLRVRRNRVLSYFPKFVSLRAMGRFVFASACVAAIVIQAIGAFWYMNVSDDVISSASAEDVTAITADPAM